MLIPLYKNAFGLDHTKKQILKKFDTAKYCQRRFIAYIALDEQENAVGQYAIFPALMNYEGKQILVGQVGDLMTHSDHQRKGLFIELAKLTHELAIEEGLQLIYTFPYGKNSSYSGFEKHLGFMAVPMDSFVIPVNTMPLCRFAYKFKATENLYSFYLKTILGLFYEATPSYQEDLRAKNETILKNKDFFEYKFAYTNGQILKTASNTIYFKITKFGSISIGDIAEYKNLDKTLEELIRYCKLSGIRSIRFELSGSNELNRFLKRKYIPSNEYFACTLPLNHQIDQRKLNFVFGDFDNF